MSDIQGFKLIGRMESKDSISHINQIFSQPHSSKGNESKKRENVQDYNNMKKKLFSMLGKHSESSKAFTISPTNSTKQQYFVSTSLQRKTKSILPKQNNTLDHKMNQHKVSKTSLQNCYNQYQQEIERKTAFLDNYTYESKSNNTKQINKVNSDSLTRNLQTDRRFLMALFEKLNGKNSIKHRRQTSQNSNKGIDSEKQSLERDKVDFKQQGSKSNNTSGQFCSQMNLNQSSTQIQQNHTNVLDDNLTQIEIRTKNLLQHYAEKLKKANFEKEILLQQIKYWKTKYQKTQQPPQLS